MSNYLKKNRDEKGAWEVENRFLKKAKKGAGNEANDDRKEEGNSSTGCSVSNGL